MIPTVKVLKKTQEPNPHKFQGRPVIKELCLQFNNKNISMCVSEVKQLYRIGSSFSNFFHQSIQFFIDVRQHSFCAVWTTTFSRNNFDFLIYYWYLSIRFGVFIGILRAKDYLLRGYSLTFSVEPAPNLYRQGPNSAA
jgi:hypothetical protein